jgi:hypothetical protein
MLGLLGWPATVAAELRGVDNCAWVTVGERTPGGPLRLEAYNQQGVPSARRAGADCATAPPVG